MSQQTKSFLQKGQSLLEVAVTIGIAALVISAVSITTLIGLKNSQFSQNQIQATKLAQEGLEAIRSMRDNNIKICIPGPVEYGWTDADFPKIVWDHNFNNDDKKIYYLDLSNITGCQLTIDKKDPELILVGGKFQRTIQILDHAANEKQFTAIVKWTDSSGSHQSVLDTILTSYKN